MPKKKNQKPAVKEVCRLFVANGSCYREARGGCKYHHDLAQRAAHLELKKQAIASIKTLNHTTPTDDPRALSLTKDSQKAPASTINGCAPVGEKKAVTIPEASLQDTRNPKAQRQANTPSVTKAPGKGCFHQKKQCKYYVNGKHCPFINRRTGCYNIHDLEARRANLAKRNHPNITEKSERPVVLAKPKQVAINNSSTVLSTAPKLLNSEKSERPVVFAKPKQVAINNNSTVLSTAPTLLNSEKSTTTTVATSSSSRASSASAPEKHWDGATDWERWAYGNLRDLTAAKFFAPYLPELNQGIIPKGFFSMPAPVAPRGAATTFHSFRILPFELRDQIWKYALADEKLDCHVEYSCKEDEFNRQIKKKIFTMGKPPKFMLINRETRTLAFKVYELAFGIEGHRGKCWFNFKADRLFLKGGSYLQYQDLIQNMAVKDRDRVRCLAIPLKDLIQGREKEIGESIVKGFRNLTHWYLVASDGLEDERWTSDMRQRAKIQTWNKRLWARLHPKRPYIPAAVIYQLIPAHLAHFYGIDCILY